MLVICKRKPWKSFKECGLHSSARLCLTTTETFQDRRQAKSSAMSMKNANHVKMNRMDGAKHKSVDANTSCASFCWKYMRQQAYKAPILITLPR